MPLSLTETQRYLWRLITAPEGVAAGLAAMADEDPRLADLLSDVVAGEEPLPPVRRLDVYANMYFFRILDSLKEDYPAVLAVLGHDAFHNLVTDYLLARPSAHWSLRYAGRSLPDFLRHAREAEARPWLADLAHLEWAILDAFDAADAPVLPAAELAALSAEAWGEVRFVPSPSVRLLELDWQVDDVWDRALRDEPPGEGVPAPCSLQVWRRDLRVYHRPLGTLERDCMRFLLAGEPFAVWCDEAASAAGDDAAAERVALILQRWIGEGVLARLE